MTHKVRLKNKPKFVLLDAEVYDWLQTDPYMSQLKVLDNLRLHSTGCAVFQKGWRKTDGTYKVETIYLHRVVADHFLQEPQKDNLCVVCVKNGNKLDCRCENLEFRSRSTTCRLRQTISRTGYVGVYHDHHRYRAIISIQGQQVHLGMFDTAEEAALAYNRASKDVYGSAAKLNKVPVLPPMSPK
jgi:hypothetical protein